MGESASVEVGGKRRPSSTPPLHRIADRCALFLDFDGTLMNLEPRPDQVAVDGGLLYLLDDLYVAAAGAVAVFSGRGLKELDALLTPLRLPAAAIHGAQRRRADGSIAKLEIPGTLVWRTRMSLRVRLRHYTGLFVEDKGCAFAVHYRGASRLSAARLRVDMQALATASGGVYEVLEGADVLELRPHGCDTGAALSSFMSEPPFAGRLPIFLGDEHSDLAGFAAVARLNGIGIAVGPRVQAPWRLPDPVAVRAWLRGCLELGL
jgi:trehalose 6-phosphate phosphatase